VRSVLVNAGGGFSNRVTQGDVFVRLTPHEQRVFSLGRLARSLAAGDPGAAWRGNTSQSDVMVEVRKRLRRFSDLRCSVRSIASFNIGGGNFEIDFSILGPDLEQLARYGDELRQRALEVGGIVDADTTLRLDSPELRAVIDRDRAADLGVDVVDIAAALRLMVGGEERVSRFRDASLGQDYDVQIRLEARDRSEPGRIAELGVPTRDGGIVRLDELVTLEPTTTAARVDRLDRERQVSLRASVAPGYALADRLAALRRIAAEMNMPPTYTTRVSGRGRELERTFEEFLWAFLLSVVLMYIILASQFESLVHPLTILLSLPLAVPFALLSLHVTNNTLNLYSALGILVLFGVVKKNSILQIDHTNQLRARGLERSQAILLANRDRLRPILMTTLTLVAGMLPLALGAGPGAEERRAVAVVVIGGQSLSLLLTLLVTPIAYSWFDDLGRLFRRRARPAEAGVGAIDGTPHTAVVPADAAAARRSKVS
jgi:HAE1 family hydrophobic/amphiphilic exporter-1